MTRVLITGAAGFVASHLAGRFARAGFDVILSDLITPADAGEIPFISLDVTSGDAVVEAFEQWRPDGVVHAAGIVGPENSVRDPGATIAVNVGGTQHILDAARATGAKVTLLSTATVYGIDPTLRRLHESDPPDPVGLYDGSKLMAETLLTAYKRSFGLDGCSIRFGFPYGLGQKIDKYFLPSAADGRPIREPAGADHPSDFTYIEDLVEGIFGAHNQPRAKHDVYNITGGVLRTRGDLARAVMAAVPAADIELGPGLQPGRHLRGPCDTSRARDDFGYEARFSLEAGVLDWAKRLGH